MTRLFAFIPCAPYRPTDRKGLGRRGLHELIEEDVGFTPLIERYLGRFVGRAEAAGVTLTPAIHLPWGKELHAVPVDGHEGQYTAMRADSKNIADADTQWSWLSPALGEELAHYFRAGVVPAVYFGGNPSAMTLGSAGLLPLHQMGFTLVGDATSIQQGTPLIESMILAHQRHKCGRGGRVMVEANWDTSGQHDMPCVAAWHLWGNEGRYAMDTAPRHSGVLWNRGINTAAEWDAAERAVKAGLDLWANLDETEDTVRLFSLVGRAA